ncbi:MAG: hypothetical protein HYV95_02520 [Opitutae bacterium]|nr:hypothetical protein [Opitutae bacterium]
MPTSPSIPVSRRGGLLFKLLLALGGLFILAAIAWVVLLPSIAASTIRSKTGFAVKVDKLSVNPFTASVQISGLVLNNPEGWPETGFVDLRRFTADAELLSLLSNRFVADEVVVDVAQLTLVKNKAGVLNAEAFKDGLAGKAEPGQEAPKGGGKKQEFLIRHLVLKFDRLVFADYSGRRPVVKNYDLNLSRDLTNVDSVTKIISPFTGAALGVVTNALGGLFKDSPDVLKELTGGLQEAGKKTGETLKSLIQSLEKKKP